MRRRSKPRAPKKSVAGTYPISTGTAVVTADAERDGAYLLEINNVPSSQIVLGAPRVVAFPYMQWIARLIDAHLHHTGSPDAHLLHLGGAGCALPRYVADKWPGTTNTVVELDEKLTRLVRELFDIPDPPQVTLTAAEARTFTHAQPPGGTGVVVRDVFAGPDTPRHLTTVEFFTAVRRALAPGGLYVANVGDYAELPHTRAEVAGLVKVFPHVAAVAGRDMVEGREYGNLVLLASDRPLGHLRGALDADLRLTSETWVQAMARSTSARRD